MNDENTGRNTVQLKTEENISAIMETTWHIVAYCRTLKKVNKGGMKVCCCVKQCST